MGIQFGHGVVEYMLKYRNFPNLTKWAENDKTFIILNGGTTNLNGTGSLNKHVMTLIENNIEFSTFHEPDLGDQLTSVNFLVDERVWNKEKYPDRFLGHPPLSNRSNSVLGVHYVPEDEEKYQARLGGEKNVFLREFLKQFRLA